VQFSGSRWYEGTFFDGNVTSPSNTYDMISPVFWLVAGNYIKITRGDDSSSTVLLLEAAAVAGKPSEAL